MKYNTIVIICFVKLWTDLNAVGLKLYFITPPQITFLYIVRKLIIQLY